MLIGLRSRKHIAPFELVRPTTAGEALAAAAAAEPGASAFMAGGIDLIDQLKRGIKVERLITLNGIAELHRIRREGDSLAIGALATHDAIATSQTIAAELPDLAVLWRSIANPRIRFAGTLGGNLMSGFAHYDGWPATLALGGSATLATQDQTHQIAVPAGLRNYPDGLLIDLRIPLGGAPPRLLADRSLHPALSVYLGAEIEHGLLRTVRFAIGGCHPHAQAIALPVAGIPVTEVGSHAIQLAQLGATSISEPASDGLASSAYRRRMVEVLSRRLLIRLGSAS